MELEFEEGPEPEIRRQKMDEGQGKQNNLVKTTDCLEAVGVFRGWKNFLFIIVALCLILLQLSFWLVNTGFVKAEGKTKQVERETEAVGLPPADRPPPEAVPPPAKDLIIPLEGNQPNQPVEQPAAEPNQPGEAGAEKQQQAGSLFGIRFKHLAWLIRFVNFVVIPAAALYCLTILFCLKVSLLGRLGGINHICRAFFLSLVMVVLLLPWQLVFGGVVAGAIYTCSELLSSYAAERDGVFEVTLYYLRFTGYWVLVVLLLIFSQVRGCRWAKATLRRLEVI
jgi:hypothetical protein